MDKQQQVRLIDEIRAQIYVLKTRDGTPVTAAQADERARNIVANLVGNGWIDETCNCVKDATP
jgi:hypothetical protein